MNPLEIKQAGHANQENFMLGIFIGAILALVLAACAGCKSTTFEHSFTDGTKVRATDRRFFVNTAADIQVTISTNGAKSVTIGVKSDPATETIKAAVESAVTGAVKGFKP